MHQPRSWTSAASPTGSSRRGTWPRSRRSPGSPLDISDFPTRHTYGLALWQSHVERILGGWVDELEVTIHRGLEVTGFAQDDTGLDFPGRDPTISHLIAEVEMAEEPDWGLRRDARGIRSLSRLEDGGPIRVLVTERRLGRTGEPTLQDLGAELVAAYGTDFGVHQATWISRFTDTAPQAASYRPDGCCWPATPPTCTTRWGGRVSTSVCRMR